MAAPEQKLSADQKGDPVLMTKMNQLLKALLILTLVANPTISFSETSPRTPEVTKESTIQSTNSAHNINIEETFWCTEIIPAELDYHRELLDALKNTDGNALKSIIERASNVRGGTVQFNTSGSFRVIDPQEINSAAQSKELFRIRFHVLLDRNKKDGLLYVRQAPWNLKDPNTNRPGEKKLPSDNVFPYKLLLKQDGVQQRSSFFGEDEIIDMGFRHYSTKNKLFADSTSSAGASRIDRISHSILEHSSSAWSFTHDFSNFRQAWQEFFTSYQNAHRAHLHFVKGHKAGILAQVISKKLSWYSLCWRQNDSTHKDTHLSFTWMEELLRGLTENFPGEIGNIIGKSGLQDVLRQTRASETLKDLALSLELSGDYLLRDQLLAKIESTLADKNLEDVELSIDDFDNFIDVDNDTLEGYVTAVLGAIMAYIATKRLPTLRLMFSARGATPSIIPPPALFQNDNEPKIYSAEQMGKRVSLTTPNGIMQNYIYYRILGLTDFFYAHLQAHENDPEVSSAIEELLEQLQRFS